VAVDGGESEGRKVRTLAPSSSSTIDCTRHEGEACHCNMRMLSTSFRTSCPRICSRVLGFGMEMPFLRNTMLGSVVHNNL